MSELRVIFMGSAALACPSLEALRALSGVRVVGVVTQPERPQGRALRKAPCPVCAHVAQSGIPVLMPENVNLPDSVAVLHDLRPGLVVVVAYGQILKPAILDLPPLGCVNLHTSLLPKYRGAAPIQWAIARGESATGVTTMFMDAGMDTGDVIFQELENIRPDDTGATLHDRLAARGAGLLARTVEAVRAGTAPRVPQDHAAATAAPRLKKTDGRLDWNLSAMELCCRIRAFNPWPACYMRWPTSRPLTVRVLEARVEPSTTGNAIPGTLLAAGCAGPLVHTGADALRLLTVQPEGKKVMTGAAFQCGYGVAPGVQMTLDFN